MRKSILSAAVAAALLVPGLAAAQAAASPITGNMSLVSDYRFRGLTQTFEEPALQGGFDYAHSSGIYLGNWNSAISDSFYAGSPLEMDFYGGYKGTAGPVGYDIGYIYYYYPNSGALGTTEINNGEFYVGGSYGPVSAKWYYGTTKFFSLGKGPTLGNPEFDTKGSWYLDLSGNFDLGGGFALQAHYGYQKIEEGHTAFAQGLVFKDEDAISDYKVGVTYDLSGWILGAAIVGTSEKGFFRTAESNFTEDSGKTKAVLSVSKTF